jgi:hypothetical protein
LGSDLRGSNVRGCTHRAARVWSISTFLIGGQEPRDLRVCEGACDDQPGRDQLGEALGACESAALEAYEGATLGASEGHTRGAQRPAPFLFVSRVS